MPPKKKATIKKKIEKPQPSLADEILNSNPEEQPPQDASIQFDDEFVEEAAPVTIEQPEQQPEVTPIPVVDPKPYEDQKGVRFFMKEMANTTPHGSIGHDLLWSVKFDERGMSEFVTDSKVIEKLRKMGWKEFKA